jgi:flagellum-specific ATP synthase
VLMGMIAARARADVVVVGLVGERGREVREFLERDLAEGAKRAVVIVATSDEPPLVRLRAAFVATTLAEYFRDQGQHVLLMLDSLTRVATAQREIGLSAGEPPTSKGHVPSLFSIMPRLLERAGPAAKGSITALYTVLVEGDDMNDPVADLTRSILDGHITLSRALAHRNQYPAVDVLQSVSRVMDNVVSKDHVAAAGELRRALSEYKDAEDLIRIGAYASGSDPSLDRAVALMPPLEAFLRQKPDEVSNFSQTSEALLKLISEPEGYQYGQI